MLEKFEISFIFIGRFLLNNFFIGQKILLADFYWTILGDKKLLWKYQKFGGPGDQKQLESCWWFGEWNGTVAVVQTAAFLAGILAQGGFNFYHNESEFLATISGLKNS